jgi:hypothetical protein
MYSTTVIQFLIPNVRPDSFIFKILIVILLWLFSLSIFPYLRSLITAILTVFITRSAVTVPLIILSFIRNSVLATESLRIRERREVRIVKIRVSV